MFLNMGRLHLTLVLCAKISMKSIEANLKLSLFLLKKEMKQLVSFVIFASDYKN